MQFRCFTLLAILLLQGISSKSINTYVPGSSPYEDDLVPINLIYANFFQNQSLINGLDMLKINEMYINSFGNIAMGSEFVNVSISKYLNFYPNFHLKEYTPILGCKSCAKACPLIFE
jgi:hypothetical protein